MKKNITHGQRIKMSELTTGPEFLVAVRLSFPPGILADIACFGVDGANQLSDDRYMIFYNQKVSPCNSIRIIRDTPSNSLVFQINLRTLHSSIQRLIFTAAIDGAGTMKSLTDGEITLIEPSGSEAAGFSFDQRNLDQEKALIIAEMYIKNEWRFAAVAQGFNEGMGALLRYFGGEEITESPPEPASPPPRPAPKAPEPPPKVSLSKITLDKKGDKKTINLEKTGTNLIHVNLNWDAPEVKKKFSLLGGFSGDAPDLDLGCMYRMKDGSMGVIQPLGKSFGSRNAPPFILLDQDDRTGESASGENLVIHRPDLVDMVMIFALIYEGAKNFTTVNGRVTVTDQKGNEVYVKLDSPDPRYGFCAVCTFKNTGGALELKKEELYFPGHREADQHFGFGFRWQRGSK